ncbi:MAG: crotonase/enoyl-CoA hydratase family protein [Actinobacteria bacterium]|nr:crotonase/enoyl-CoA hydratase family protein [Actinomycetota bacterium]
MADELLIERSGPVLELVINRPEARNALNLAVAEGIARGLDTLDRDPTLGVGVIAATGPNFSSGMDLKAFARGEVPEVADRGFAGIVERPATKPLIAAVEGYAVAGGFEVALACDLIVASREAKFSLPEVKVGLIAAGGALLRLPRRIPYNEAARLALTGDFLTAERADALGLLAAVVDPGEARGAAGALAARIAANAPLALAATKASLALSSVPEPEAWPAQRVIDDRIKASADAREGARAFAEKRPPAWSGS